MKMLSILVGKLVYILCSLVGRGSSFPGSIAKKIDKNILKKFKLPEKVIVVTGSSGKGSTSSIIAHVLRENGYKVSHNTAGGNETSGVITTLLLGSNLLGKVKSDVVVLEIDERYIKYIFPYLKPSDVLITNVTRDQPPRQRHPDFIIQEISKGLTNKMHLYLNADDPILEKFLLNDKFDVTYYSIDKTKYSYKEKLFDILNITRCPYCNSSLEYDFYHFEEIGKYKCPSCDFKIPKAKYKITEFDKDKKTCTIDKKYKINLNNDMLYNLYNTLGAFSVLGDMNIDKDKISESISKLNKNTKVFSKYKYKERDVYVLNNKCENSTTYNQSMLYTYESKKKKTVVIGWHEISRRYLWDELSWLYDVEFELFKDQNIDKIIAAGPQRYDIAVRLKYAGIDEKKIKIHKDLYAAEKEIKNSKGDIYAILNFDYLDDFDKVMGRSK